MDPKVLCEIQKIDRQVLKSGFDNTTELLESDQRRGFANEERGHRNNQHVLSDLHDTSNYNLSATERKGTDTITAVNNSTSRLDTDLYRVAGQLDTCIHEYEHSINDNLYKIF